MVHRLVLYVGFTEILRCFFLVVVCLCLLLIGLIARCFMPFGISVRPSCLSLI